jgi:hypothetical protein
MNMNEAEKIIRKIAKSIALDSILVGLALVKHLELDKEDRLIKEAYELVNGTIEATLYKELITKSFVDQLARA